jgi:hypothetical protein
MPSHFKFKECNEESASCCELFTKIIEYSRLPACLQISSRAIRY